MQFVYHEKVGEEKFVIDLNEYAHLFKVRRVGLGDVLEWRNLRDAYMYTYKIANIGKKEAILERVSQKEQSVKSPKSLHVGWCIIDPKIIEKTLPMLNELGVEKISLVYADFSQKQYKMDEERMHRILINSSQQCGRSHLMEIEIINSVKTYCEMYPKSSILDFCDTPIDDKSVISSILIGPEGGFSEKERILLAQRAIFGLSCPSILRSETAVIAVASKILI